MTTARRAAAAPSDHPDPPASGATVAVLLALVATLLVATLVATGASGAAAPGGEVGTAAVSSGEVGTAAVSSGDVGTSGVSGSDTGTSAVSSGDVGTPSVSGVVQSAATSGGAASAAYVAGAAESGAVASGSAPSAAGGTPSATGGTAAGPRQHAVALAAAQDDPESTDDGAGDGAARNGSERVLHEHPDVASGIGDDGAVAEWLLDRMQWTLADSTEALAEGDAERARELLDGVYADRLEQYAEVADDTNWRTEDPADPRTRDEVAAEEFAAVEESQRELADLVAEYERTLAAYEAARDAGEEERAVELARELVALSEEIEAVGGELDERYARLETVVERDLSPVRTAVDDVARQHREETDRVASEAFVETELRLSVEDASVSPVDPLVVEGRLLDADGEPVEGATVTVRDPTRAVADGAGAGAAGREGVGSGAATTATTGADGSFRLEHRAAFVPLDAEAFEVRYRPDRLAPYRAVRRSVPVEVGQVEGDLEVVDAPDDARYGEPVRVEVAATVDGEPVPGVPVRTRAGGATAAATTDEDGTVALETELPRDVPPGERALPVVAPVEGWSVAFPDGEAELTVRETDTALEADVVARGGGTGNESGAEGASAIVEGRLETASGEPVTDAPVQLAVEEGELDAGGASGATAGDANGSTGASTRTATVRTGPEGAFAVPLDAPAGERVTVRYDEPDSNLESATATATVPDAVAGGGSDDGGLLAGVRGALADLVAGAGAADALFGLGAVVVAALVAGGWVLRRRRESGPVVDVEGAGETPAAVPDATDADDGEDLLAAATDAVADAPTEATLLAYGAGRRALDADVGVGPDATHTEFLSHCEADGLSPEAVDAVRELTECYEDAAYAPGSVDPSTARAAVAAAERLQ